MTALVAMIPTVLLLMVIPAIVGDDNSLWNLMIVPVFYLTLHWLARKIVPADVEH